MLKLHFTRYVLVGAISTALMFALVILFVEVFGMAATPSSAGGYIISGGLNYWLNYHWTFASEQNHGVAAQRFLAVALMGLGINTIIMYVLAQRLGLYYVAVQVIASIVVLMWNFAANRHWTFKAHRKSSS